MRLSDVDIREEVENGELSISPLDHSEQIQPSSVDLRLGDSVQYIQSSRGRAFDITHSKPRVIEEDNDVQHVSIGPDECVLAETRETISLPDYIDGEVWGRSSIGRLFLNIHTAGYIDAGFSGNITLELVNHSENTYQLPAGMRICQVTFNYLNQPAETGYDDKEDAKYSGQDGVTSSRITQDF